jgi:hypothetical protein
MNEAYAKIAEDAAKLAENIKMLPEQIERKPEKLLEDLNTKNWIQDFEDDEDELYKKNLKMTNLELGNAKGSHDKQLDIQVAKEQRRMRIG